LTTSNLNTDKVLFIDICIFCIYKLNTGHQCRENYLFCILPLWHGIHFQTLTPML